MDPDLCKLMRITYHTIINHRVVHEVESIRIGVRVGEDLDMISSLGSSSSAIVVDALSVRRRVGHGTKVLNGRRSKRDVNWSLCVNARHSRCENRKESDMHDEKTEETLA